MSALARVQRMLALLRDPRVAKLPRFAVLAAAAYLLWPVDLLPEIALPIVGWLDDATLIWMALRWLTKAGRRSGQGRPARHPDRQAHRLTRLVPTSRRRCDARSDATVAAVVHGIRARRRSARARAISLRATGSPWLAQCYCTPSR